VSPEIRPFPKAGPPQKKRGKKAWKKNRILTDTPEKTENENQRARKGKKKN